MKKKIILTSFAASLLLASTSIAFAGTPMEYPVNQPSPTTQETETITPYWTGLIMINTQLNESPKGYANPFYIISARTDKINKAKIITTLQQYDNGWKTIKTWNETISLSATVTYYEKSYPVSTDKQHSYRFKWDVTTLKNNTVVDHVTDISPTKVI